MTARKSQQLIYLGLLFCSIALPRLAWSQNSIARLVEREQQLNDTIAIAESADGPNSLALLVPLRELTQFYEEMGDLDLADEVDARVRQVIRANKGLFSLEQADLIKQLMARELLRGDVVAAWDLEQELLRLVDKNPGDIRDAQILRDVADRRIQILDRYEAGEMPYEIILGCYYDDRAAYRDAWTRGSRPIYSAPGEQEDNECAAGSRRVARTALAGEAQWYYAAAVNVYLENEQYSNEDFKELLTDLIVNTYKYANPALGRNSLENLLAYETANPDSPLPRIQTLVYIADWNLYYSRDFGTKFRDQALATYQQALDLLAEQRIPQPSIDEIFAPAIPIVLPTFRDNPLITEGTSGQQDWLEVAFVIESSGKSDDIEIIARSGDVPRATARELVQFIRRSRFRPRAENGQILNSAPITIRYYFSS